MLDFRRLQNVQFKKNTPAIAILYPRHLKMQVDNNAAIPFASINYLIGSK